MRLLRAGLGLECMWNVLGSDCHRCCGLHDRFSGLGALRVIRSFVNCMSSGDFPLWLPRLSRPPAVQRRLHEHRC